MLELFLLIIIILLIKLYSEQTKLLKRFNTLENNFNHFYKNEKSTINITVKENELHKEQTLDDYLKMKTKKELASKVNVDIGKKDTSNREETPSVIDKYLESIKTYFTTGNPLVKIGGVILFFGLSFLIKFAVSNDMVSIEFGLLCVMAFSISLIVIGFKQKDRKDSFGLILQGIGIALFYLVVFSSAKYFNVISLSFALLIMILTVVFATFLAIIQNSFYLAVFATVGGFLSPIITSTGSGSHIILFSYYSLLNIGIAIIAWYKSWRFLNLVGFSFTFLIGSLWGYYSYTEEFFYSTELFLIFFFLLYLIIPLLYARKTTFNMKAYVDSTLVFGLPIIAFSLQIALLKDYNYLLSFSALGLATIYLSLALWISKKDYFSLLAESYLALGVVFLTLVFAYAFSPKISSVIFSLEGAAIVWISLRQEKLYSRLIALALQLYALIVFLKNIKYEEFLFLNYSYLGLIMISISILLSAYLYDRYNDRLKGFENDFSKIMLSIGILVWILAGYHQLHKDYIAFFIIYVSLSTFVFMYIGLKYTWENMQRALEYFFLVTLLFTLNIIYFNNHPFQNYCFIAIPTMLGIYYLLLYKKEFMYKKYWHSIGLWITLLFISCESYYHIEKFSNTIALSAISIFYIFSIYFIINTKIRWPFNQEDETYKKLGILGLSLVLVLWNLLSFLNPGTILNSFYIPLVNPLDIMQISSIVIIVYWLNHINIHYTIIIKFSAFTCMALITLILARTVYNYTDIEYTLNSLLNSNIFQTSISILYTIIALAVIIYSKYKVNRLAWISGAALLGFVIFKLVIFELVQAGTLERIISFLVVGTLILIVGYIAPLPPKKEAN